MKYFYILLIVSLLSCSKDAEPPVPVPDPPTVSVSVSPVDVNGSLYPQFSISLDIPTPESVTEFYIYVKKEFPFSEPLKISNPKTGIYTLVDMNNLYPSAGDSTVYFSVFALANHTYITNKTIIAN